MRILQNIKFYFVIISLVTIWLFVEHYNMKSKFEEQNKKVDELTKRCDSLGQEIFVRELVIGSYEVMWGILEETDKELADSINNQVE